MTNNGDGLTMTVLGCGTMGIAILSGVLASLSDATASRSSAAADEEIPTRLPTRFIACVRSEKSANRIRAALGSYEKQLTVAIGDNNNSIRKADVVLLGCKPYAFRETLSEHGLVESLRGKLLISILAGVTVSQIEEQLYGSVSNDDPMQDGRCRIIRAMPNTAAGVRESMTVIAHSVPPLPNDVSALVTWIFNQIGRVAKLPASNLDVCTALCGSGPAFMALILEAAADGAVAMGLPRAEAQLMAAQAMRGTTGLVLGGEHPAILRDKVSTPGGCTIGGLLVLEEKGVRGAVARAVREATVVASQLGQGVQGVNGTRF